ncbi:CPBP family intramembrane metalloprotease [Streptomonospora sp. S1-112]|uniref:CPBP family intramembrane metalloprotease n=1 Tax=Streptomonospora mangrovi TaxID=2883123 RepID=A0A9X3NRE3_9ACTN|nr:CPBP family intramembrane glutamic endopeptidase [Streptomonospora mangrovi]MDA0566941.1 CPBP family intramembrane metalloprotease [Streptomonospora mangrovi]
MQIRTTPLIVGCCLAAVALALGALVATGHTDLRLSTDAEADTTPLLAVASSLAAGLLLIRLVPPRLPAPAPWPAEERPALTRQALGLTAVAVAVVLALVALRDTAFYGAAKVALLLGGAALVLLLWRSPSPLRRARAEVPARWRLLAPVPAVVCWAYLLYYSPLAGSSDVSAYAGLDRAYLILAMALTFLTASVTEEVFYRLLLQTRLEALLGRWGAILPTALLFAAMHLSRLVETPTWQALATIAVWHGGLGILLGYLWSRHRSVWGVLAVHTAVNSLILLPVVLG